MLYIIICVTNEANCKEILVHIRKRPDEQTFNGRLSTDAANCMRMSR